MFQLDLYGKRIVWSVQFILVSVSDIAEIFAETFVWQWSIRWSEENACSQ